MPRGQRLVIEALLDPRLTGSWSAAPETYLGRATAFNDLLVGHIIRCQQTDDGRGIDFHVCMHTDGVTVQALCESLAQWGLVGPARDAVRLRFD